MLKYCICVFIYIYFLEAGILDVQAKHDLHDFIFASAKCYAKKFS